MDKNATIELIPINEFNKIASLILNDRKESNKLVDLIDLLAKNNYINDNYLELLIKCLTEIFTKFIETRELVLFGNVSNQQFQNINQYKTWLINLYDNLIELFLQILTNLDGKHKFNLQKIILQNLLKFVEFEGKYPFRESDENDLSFPVKLLKKIIDTLIVENVYNQELISIYSEHYQYDDFIHFTMKLLIDKIDEYKTNDNVNIMSNIIDFIHPIRLIRPDDLLPKCLQIGDTIIKKKKRKNKKHEHRAWRRLCELQKYNGTHQPISLANKKFKFDYERDADIYSSLWLKYLTLPLHPATFKRSLLYLDKYAIQHFANPLLLADFLISSFNMGGIISLLSLSPLYTLIYKCNLEYPNFYCQLYNLLEPAITYVKHRSRFLFWCDLFLTSTHIPASIVASFAKKFSRLALYSTPDTILIILPFIGNLFIRHPLIKKLLDYKQFEPEQDPFLVNESDPEKTNSLNSYVWELNVLQSHYHPKVASLAKQVCGELPRNEWLLEDILETSLDDVMVETRNSLNDIKKFTYDIDCGMYYEL